MPQVTLIQFPVAVVGVPPVIIQLMVPLPVAQYECVLLAQTMELPVMTGIEGGATTVTNRKAVSVQVALRFNGTAVIIKLPVNPFQFTVVEGAGPAAMMGPAGETLHVRGIPRFEE